MSQQISGSFAISEYKYNSKDLYLICERVSNSFKKQLFDRRSSSEVSLGNWTDYGWQFGLRDWTTALHEGNINSIINFALSFFSTPASYGIAMGYNELENIRASSQSIKLYEEQWLSALKQLAKVLGCVSVCNPELSELLDDDEVSISELIRSVECRLGYAIDFPKGFGTYGCISSGSNVFPKIAYNHILAEFYCRELLLNKSDIWVAEIGGGIGSLAYFLNKKHRLNYVCFDTAPILAFQGIFLAIAYPDIPLRLYGESKISPITTSFQSITLLPSWVLKEKPISNLISSELDLIINQDSILELSAEDIQLLIKPLTSVMRGPLLSIGPDYSSSSLQWGRKRGIQDELRKLGLKIVDRVPFAVRDGYMREIYIKQT